jgi:hypothetical protein
VLSAGAAAAQNKPLDTTMAVRRYLQEARAAKPASSAVNSWAWMSGLALDPRAHNVNDLITIRVMESITGSGSADSALKKASDGTAGVAKFFGLETKLPPAVDPAALVATKSSTDFKGSGDQPGGRVDGADDARVSDVLLAAIWWSKACAKSKSTAIGKSSSSPASSGRWMSARATWSFPRRSASCASAISDAG